MVSVVLAVDGLSTIDSKTANNDSLKHVIDTLSSIPIPGWTLNQTSVVLFKFSDTRQSHMQIQTGDIANAGAIGFMVFAEVVWEKE